MQVMANFRQSVVDGEGRVRQLSNDRLNELAEAAAKGLLIRV